MSRVKTYLVVWFNSDGESVSEVTRRLMSMGFKPVQGEYDYVYEWPKKPGMKELLSLGDQVQETLRDCRVEFKLETK